MTRRVRMSPVDTAWLRMDRDAHLTAIKGVLVLDRPLTRQRLLQLLQRRLVDRFPRFRQRAVCDGQGAWWEDDPQFSLARHVRCRRLKSTDPQRSLQDCVSHLATEPLPADRPLWSIELLHRAGLGSALVVRVHHCMADGLALVGVMLSLTDAQAEAPDAPPRSRPRSSPGGQDLQQDPWAALLDPLTEAAMDSLETAQAIRQRYERIAADPQAAQVFHLQGAVLVAELLKLLMLPQDGPTRFKPRLSGGPKRVAWAQPLALQEVKALARYLDCTVNDVLLSCAAGALRDELLARGDDVQGLEIRVMVPVNLRRGRQVEDLGNRFGLVPLLLPLHEPHPLRRLGLVRQRMSALKNSMLPPLSLGLMGLMGLAAPSVQQAAQDLLTARATAVMSHVPGPTGKRWLAGARIDQLMFWVPQSNGIGLGVSILSYAGQVSFGLISDALGMPAPEAIAPRFRQAFEDLLYGVLMGAQPDPPPPQR